MKRVFPLLMLFFLLSVAANGQDSIKSRLVERVVQHISTRCHFNDSTRASLHTFFSGYVDELSSCLHDPDCRSDQLKRSQIHYGMLAGLRKQFGKSAVKAYLKLTLLPPKHRKVVRLRTSRYIKLPGGRRLQRLDIHLD